MGQATLQGMFAVKLPASDLTRSRAWYEQVFGFIPEIEFPDDDGVVRGVAGHLPGVADPVFALREDPAAARGGGRLQPVEPGRGRSCQRRGVGEPSG